MLITIAIFSILIITIFVWLLNKIIPFRICPICAGVSGTWLWLVAASLLGYSIDLAVPALLMGGSVVGIAYQLEKKLPTFAEATVGRPAESAGWRTPLLWKTLFIPAGFIAAYSILTQWWDIFLISLVFMALIALLFFSSRKDGGGRKESIEELEKKMKNCC